MPSARMAAAARSDTTSTFCAPPAGRSRDASVSARSTLHVGHKKLFHAAFQQSVSHGGPGAASAEQQHRFALFAGKPAAKALLEARHVGVVADAPAALQYDGVDGAEDLSRRGKLVEQRDDFLLVGERHVEAGEAEILGKRYELAQGRGGFAHRFGIEERIDVGETLGAAFRLVHRGRPGKLNSAPEQADQYAARTGGHLPVLGNSGRPSRPNDPPKSNERTLYQPVNYVKNFVPFG